MVRLGRLKNQKREQTFGAIQLIKKMNHRIDLVKALQNDLDLGSRKWFESRQSSDVRSIVTFGCQIHFTYTSMSQWDYLELNFILPIAAESIPAQSRGWTIE